MQTKSKARGFLVPITNHDASIPVSAFYSGLGYPTRVVPAGLAPLNVVRSPGRCARMSVMIYVGYDYFFSYQVFIPA
jgi:hypothetical protein